MPENPNFRSELNVIVQSEDADHDLVTYRYQWLRNDEEIVEKNQSTLISGNFNKGDLIRVKITPSDGKTEGQMFSSQPVKILNSPPLIKEVKIEPSIAYASDTLRASLRTYDPDGDPITYTYQWEKNGIVLNEERNDILQAGRFKRGDTLAVTVTPFDGETLDTPKKSEPIVIANSPPIITSLPSNKIDRNIYTYRVTAKDPDNDPITFTLKTAPRGMEIDKETGLVSWEIRHGDQGAQSIEIEASDSEGAKSFQRYTLSIELK